MAGRWIHIELVVLGAQYAKMKFLFNKNNPNLYTWCPTTKFKILTSTQCRRTKSL